MIARLLFSAFILLAFSGAAGAKTANEYLYHVTGNPKDVTAKTAGGLMLMGGGTDVDQAFQWMIQQSGGGDFVVIRASGSEAYNPYIAGLGTLDSVETIVFQSRAASTDAFVIDKIRNAEALFIAGGDQANYLRFWKDTPVCEAIQQLVKRRVPIGGTSAGLAVLGEFLFPAYKDTVRSAEALANPFHEAVILDRNFLTLPDLKGLITDSHFVERDRFGRLVVFLARLVKDGWAKDARGIGIDRETAVLIEPGGKARIVGNHTAYFLRVKTAPQVCEAGRPLTFDKVEVVKNPAGSRFDLTTWSGVGGESYKVSARSGKLVSTKADGKIY